LEKLSGAELEKTIGQMLQDPRRRKRFRLFFNNEYYPALIPVTDKMVILHKVVDGLIERQAEPDRLRLTEHGRLLANQVFVRFV